MKKLFIISVMTSFILAGTLSCAWSADVAKIGVISFDKILSSSSAGKMTQKQLQAKGAELKGKLEKEKTEIEALSKAFERESLVLSPEKKKEKEREFRIRVNDLKKMQQDFSKELKGMEIKLVKQIEKDVFEIADKMGKEEGYLLILERKSAGVVYMPAQIDITDALIKKYNDAKASKSQ